MALHLALVEPDPSDEDAQPRYQVDQVPPAGVSYLAPYVAPLIERAIENGPVRLESTEDVLRSVASGVAGLLIVRCGNEIDGIMVVSVAVHPDHQVLRVVYVAGKHMARWFDVAQIALMDLARERGCQAIEASTSRQGWGRWLRSTPYEPVATIWRRAV